MFSSLPRVYPLIGFCSGYAIVMLFNPLRQALRDGARCLARFKRIWVTFVVLGLAYALFQFATFTPIQNEADLDLNQFASLPAWQWPRSRSEKGLRPGAAAICAPAKDWLKRGLQAYVRCLLRGGDAN